MQRASAAATRIADVYMKTCVAPLLAAGSSLGGCAGACTGLREAREGGGVSRDFTTPLTVSLYAAGGACIGLCLPFLPLMAVPLGAAYGIEKMRRRRASA